MVARLLYPVNAQQVIVSLRFSSVWPGVSTEREQG